jgi:hypothetical protein
MARAGLGDQRAALPGLEIYHVKGSAADPDRLYASQSGSWFGQQIQRSDDLAAAPGTRWERVHLRGRRRYPSVLRRHPGALEVHPGLAPEPSLHDPDTIYAGVEDAALFRSVDGGGSWQELPGLRGHGTGPSWQPGAGGMCLHSILLDPRDEAHMTIAISAAGTFRTDDGGKTWRAINRGLRSEGIPDADAEVGHCVHHIAAHPTRPDTLFMQKHWDVMRSDDGGEHWREISGDLPTDFGFVIDVHAHEPETVYVVPITTHPHAARRKRTEADRRRQGAADPWPAAGAIRQRPARRDGRCDPSTQICFGTTGGVRVAGFGDTWARSSATAVEVQTPP